MAHLETARFNEVIGLQIGAIQEDVQKLDVNSDLKELEANVLLLEKRVAALKTSLASFPHEHPEALLRA